MTRDALAEVPLADEGRPPETPALRAARLREGAAGEAETVERMTTDREKELELHVEGLERMLADLADEPPDGHNHEWHYEQIALYARSDEANKLAIRGYHLDSGPAHLRRDLKDDGGESGGEA